DPPDGYICAQGSPCQGEGRCAADKCVRGPSTTLESKWDFDSIYSGDLDAGIPPEQLHDFVSEENGAVSLLGFFQAPPKLRANTPEMKLAADGPARRCMLWNNRLICADYPAAVNGKISALNLATGETVWTFDARTARSDFL